MVAIAQLVEPRIVIPVVASSSLVSHPIILVALLPFLIKFEIKHKSMESVFVAQLGTWNKRDQRIDPL